MVNTAEHLPGIQNVQAVLGSLQMRDTSNWMLNKGIFKQINQMLSPFKIDLFANRMNTQLEKVHELASRPICDGNGCIQDAIEQQNGVCFHSILPNNEVFV